MRRGRVHFGERAYQARRMRGRRCLLLDFGERAHLLGCRLGKEQVGEQLPKRGIRIAPSDLDQMDQALDRCAISQVWVTADTAARKGAAQHEVADALRMPCGIGYRYRAALRFCQ